MAARIAGRVDVALVIGGEHHRPFEPGEVLAALHAHGCENTRERKNPGRKAHAAEQADGRAAVPAREVHGVAVFGDGAPAHARGVSRSATL